MTGFFQEDNYQNRAFLAVFARLDFSIVDFRNEKMLEVLFKYAPWFTLLALAVFIPMKLYTSLWEYASVDELIHIILSVVLICAIEMLGQLTGIIRNLPMSFTLLNGLFLICFISVTRSSYRLLRGLRHKRTKHDRQKRTMLIGAGNAGMLVLREFQNSENSQNRVVCIVDDDPLKRGQYLRNVKIPAAEMTLSAWSRRCGLKKSFLQFRLREHRTERTF